MSKIKQSSFKGWSILWKYLSGYQRELKVLSLLGIISAFANGTVPYIAGRFFDAILKPSATFSTPHFSVSLWVAFLFVWGVFQMVAIVVDWISDVKMEKFASKLLVDYRVNAYTRLMLLPLDFHKGSKPGEIMEGIGRAAMGLYSIASRIVIGLAPQFFSIFVGLGFTFFMNVQLASVLTLGVLIYVLIILRMVPQAIPLQVEAFKNWKKAHGISQETITNVSMVKQFAAETFQSTKIKNQYDNANHINIAIHRIWTNVAFSRRTVVFVTQLVIFILSVFAIQAGTMTLGQLLAFNAYAAMVFGPFAILGTNWQTLQNGLVAIENTETVLTLPTEDYTPVDSVIPKETHGAIEFKKVSFGYKKGQDILKDVSFTALPGQMVALVGESGAGKSTLIDLVSAYYFPGRGTVTVDGVQTNKWNLISLRNMIAIVPQEVSLFNDTITKNLAYGQKKHSKTAVVKAVREAHADAFIEKFPKKYEQIVGERGVKLSVGQKQRIAIARAILRNPKILILDEPTSALDSETEKFVTEALDRVMEGRTTFVIAHRLSTVRKADKILVLERVAGLLSQAPTTS